MLHYKITEKSQELERKFDDAIKEGAQAARDYQACDQIRDLHERVQARMKAADAMHNAKRKENRAWELLQEYSHSVEGRVY